MTGIPPHLFDDFLEDLQRELGYPPPVKYCRARFAALYDEASHAARETEDAEEAEATIIVFLIDALLLEFGLQHMVAKAKPVEIQYMRGSAR